MFKAIKNLVCLTRHKAHWQRLREDTVKGLGALWYCNRCEKQWYQDRKKPLTAVQCVGCLRTFHESAISETVAYEGLCSSCIFREDYNAARRELGAREVPYPEPITRVPLPVQLTAPQTVETEYGAAVMTPPGTPYYPPGKDNPRPPPYVFGMPAPEKPVDNSGQAQQFAVRAAVTQSGEQLIGRRTGGAFHFTGRGAGPPKPADKVQPSDSSYSNLPHPRAILRGRAKDAE